MTTDHELTVAHLCWEVGDLVSYVSPRIKGHPPVKGRVTLVYKDVTGVFVAFIVTSHTHPLHAKNMELVFRWDDRGLIRRKRRLRTFNDGTKL